MQTLYFAWFGLVEIRHFELKQSHEFTQFVGKLMFGTYSGIMIIVLINMLIAMLSTSFQIISVGWKSRNRFIWMYTYLLVWQDYGKYMYMCLSAQ